MPPRVSSRKPPPKAGYHHGNLREALVQAGLLHLEKVGPAEFSLRELARSVGVSANAAYRHFEDKSALLAALAAEGFRRLREAQLAAEKPGRPARETLVQAGRAYVAFARANPALYRLMFGREDGVDPGSELGQAGQASFMTLMGHVAGSQHLAPGDARVLSGAVFAWALTHGLSQLAIDGRIDHLGGDREQLIEQVLQMAGAPART